MLKILLIILDLENLEKLGNRVQHGKNIYFTRVVVTFALLGHQTSHSQNKFFFPSCTMYYSY